MNRVVQPKPYNVSYKETYCVHSVKIVRGTQVLILVSMWSCLYNAFTCIIGTKYRDWFLTPAFKDCLLDPHWSDLVTFWGVIDTFMLLITYNLRYALVLLQIIEWHSMIQIIVTQDKLRVEQIMWNVNMKESDDSGIFFNFKSGEQRQKCLYTFFFGLYLLVWLFDQGF